MPAVAAVLFEFCVRELRLRKLSGQADRTLSTWRWLHPAERIRVQIHMAADAQVLTEAATRHVRVDNAARRLYQLKTALETHDQLQAHGGMARRRIRQAEHRAHRALALAGFADPAIATAVLRQVQVLTMTAALARLDYRTPDAAQAAMANLIASPRAAKPGPDTGNRAGHPTAQHGTTRGAAARESMPANRINGHPANGIYDADARGAQLVAAATRIVAAAARDGSRLSQAALADRLRCEGFTIANNRLHWLSWASGLEPRHATQPDWQPQADQ